MNPIQEVTLTLSMSQAKYIATVLDWNNKGKTYPITDTLLVSILQGINQTAMDSFEKGDIPAPMSTLSAPACLEH